MKKLREGLRIAGTLNFKTGDDPGLGPRQQPPGGAGLESFDSNRKAGGNIPSGLANGDDGTRTRNTRIDSPVL